MSALPMITRMQRSRGTAQVALALAHSRPRLVQLMQQGSAKAILPRGTDIPEIVFLNTSGGLTGGDRLNWRLDLGPGVRAIATSQTAERAYRSQDGHAQVEIALHVGADGWLDWLPQETILFDQCALHRRTTIDLGAGAGCLAVEAVVLGRSAMGETVTTLTLRDWREIRRDGRPVLLEPLALDSAALTGGPAVLGGARAFASLALVTQGAEDALTALRTVLDEPGVEAAASGFDGKLTCRMRARDGWPLRRQIIRALTVLRRGPMPRNWQTLERQR